MDILDMQKNVQSFVKQRIAAGESFPTAFDVAERLGLPVSVADRALRNLNGLGEIIFPYTQSTEF
jgi:ribosomal protein S25